MPAAPRKRPPEWRPRRDWGRLLALVLCAGFAVVGAVPLVLGLLVRTALVRSWAARETSDLLSRKLGISAHYRVSVQAWPILIALDDVVVDASDGGSPFLEVERVAVRPRPFSLLAGKLDVGDVEIVGPRVRAVIEKGALQNLAYRRATSPSGASPEPPLTSISITDARVDAIIDGARVDTREVDLDVSVEDDGALEIALRAGLSQVTRVRAFPGREGTEDAVDDDTICRLDARVRVRGRTVVVRRLLLQGSADLDPDPGTAPPCVLRPGDWRAVDVRLGSARIELPEVGPIVAHGRVHARLPAAIVHRFIDAPHATGSITIDVDADYDGVSLLPVVTGHVTAEDPGADGKVFAQHAELDLATTAEGAVIGSRLVAAWADGKVTIPEVRVEPFAKGVPLNSGPITLEGIEFHSLLHDLGVHPQSHVHWTIDHGRFEHLRGTLSPVMIEGPLAFSTHGFEIFDRPVIDPSHGHMMGVKEGSLHGTFLINGQEHAPGFKFPGIVFSNFAIDTPKSHVGATVSLGFLSVMDIEVLEGTRIDLAEISPLITIPVAGVASLKAAGHGGFDHPKFTGEVAIKDFNFAGFPVGDLEPSRVAFEPLVLDLIDARLRHGQSRLRTPLTRIAFDKGPDVLIDGDVDTRDAPFARIRDMLEIFRFDRDPRFANIDGIAKARSHVHFALGGKEDRCGGGLLDVRTMADFADVQIFGERYEEGAADVDLHWDDQAAGAAGMQIDLRSGSVRKGGGGILASATVRHGGVVQGTAIASGIPIAKLDMFGAAGKLFDGTMSFVANLGGTLSDFEATADVNVSRIRIGPQSLPPSHFRLAMEGTGKPAGGGPRTVCGDPASAPFDLVEYEKDLPAGAFRLNGSLFGGQVALDDVRFSRQKHMVMDGKITAKDLDLGTLANLAPDVAFAETQPTGKLSGALEVKRYPFDAPARAEMTASVDRLSLEREGNSVRLAAPSGPIELIGDELRVPDLRIEARTKGGLAATFITGGAVHRAMTVPDLDLNARALPLDLARLGADIAGVDRAAGVASASLRVAGPPSALRFTGAAHLQKGELDLTGSPLPLQDVNIDVDISGGDARLTRATARVGGGTVEVTGRMPLRGAELGAITGTVLAHGVKVPAADGVNLTADAELAVSFRPSASSSGPRSLPEVKGSVSLTSFTYTRPIELGVSQLGRGNRSVVKSYDPANDLVRFEVKLVSPHPLRFTNNLVDMELSVVEPGLVLSGTNQRFGARGALRVVPDSKLQLRNNEFLVREGTVRFDDPLKIAPQVDVRAQTEYRRYASAAAEQATASAEGSVTSAAGTQSGSGIWRITLVAHGDADNLKMTLSSDPPLSQEDIVLLLTIGMTRAEIDRGAASSLGETMGLEALSALTGADQAVKTIVPLLDEFRFGSGYSSKTGRTEPTVTVGKRITNSVRATVTTGVTENREVRSNVEWRLNRSMSVQGSYDNVNDVSDSTLGNVGADLRLRLEFE